MCVCVRECGYKRNGKIAFAMGRSYSFLNACIRLVQYNQSSSVIAKGLGHGFTVIAIYTDLQIPILTSPPARLSVSLSPPFLEKGFSQRYTIQCWGKTAVLLLGRSVPSSK